ncbi:carboxypeptidase regulatory-like domain-containing protein [Cellulomonas sp. Sa3CUA2]|uniref:alpha-amylase n=1 Tax=Cellulomonas avistercoris TaxID=2762242 RepID=A0ABR8QG11_9CELL|nr:carboxypeptidase regulatory-like domain-containing protein [Cellulomonas avistercoris]MBD7919350.1 carboxypeptidase regulatory-like domain-containing protein [Cellulomonas avistercoris]
MRSSRRPTLASLLSLVASALVAVLVVGAPAAGVAPTPTPTWPGPVPTPCPSRSPVPAPEPTSDAGPGALATSAGPVPLSTPVACIPLGTSTLGGRVTDEGGTPVQGATVRVRSTSSGEVTASTDGDGWWAVGSLPGGSYRVSFDAWQQGFVSEWWDDAPDSVTATVVTLAEGESVRDLQTRLARTATLSGRVVAPGGTVPTGTSVMVDDATASGTYGYAPVGADGTYQVDGLDPGSYVVRAVPPAGSSWGTTYYPDARGPATATPVTVAAGQRLDGLDVTLQSSVGITGTVTLPPGTDPSQVRVVATPLDDPRLWVRAAGVAADGTYRVADVFPGSYTVRVEDAGANPPVTTRYYPDSPTADGARPVVVAEGADTTGIDITAVAASRVTGVVTGASGPLMWVEVMLEPVHGGAGFGPTFTDAPVHGGAGFGPTFTDAQGAFSFDGLPAGEYRVRFTVPTDGRNRTLYFRAPSGTVAQARAASVVKVGSGATLEVRARVQGRS